MREGWFGCISTEAVGDGTLPIASKATIWQRRTFFRRYPEQNRLRRERLQVNTGVNSQILYIFGLGGEGGLELS